MRKLLQLIDGVLTSGRPFDPAVALAAYAEQTSLGARDNRWPRAPSIASSGLRT
jgi:hypothetical protein